VSAKKEGKGGILTLPLPFGFLKNLLLKEFIRNILFFCDGGYTVSGYGQSHLRTSLAFISLILLM
jgi:hypothetical protein